MRIRPVEVSGELEILDHRRARLRDLLDLGFVTPDLQKEIARQLAEVEMKMWELGHEMPAPLRKAA